METSENKLAQDAEKLSKLNSHITYRIAILAKLLEVEAAERLQDTGFNVNTYRVLMLLSIFEELTAADLRHFMVVDRAYVSRVTSELLKLGYIQSRDHSSNRLKKMLSLTEAGRIEHAKLSKLFTTRSKLVEDVLDDDELVYFSTILDKMNDAMRAKLGR